MQEKNPEEPIITKLESKLLFFKDLEDEFIEIIHTMEVKYFGVIMTAFQVAKKKKQKKTLK